MKKTISFMGQAEALQVESAVVHVHEIRPHLNETDLYEPSEDFNAAAMDAHVNDRAGPDLENQCIHAHKAGMAWQHDCISSWKANLPARLLSNEAVHYAKALELDSESTESIQTILRGSKCIISGGAAHATLIDSAEPGKQRKGACPEVCCTGTGDSVGNRSSLAS